MTTRLVLWRHGITDWNERGIFQGQADIPLNERGSAQAAQAARALAAMGPDAIYCSPMIRAQQTAAKVVALTGLEPVIDPRLAEIDVGTWVGRGLAEVPVLDAEAGAALMGGRDFRRSPTGETMTEVGARVGECLRELASQHAGETVLVVSHGGAIRMGIVAVLGWSYQMGIALGGMTNCGWSRLCWQGGGGDSGAPQSAGRWRLEVYNHAPAFDMLGTNAGR